ncbi:MAG: DUF1573 domain-containing protein [Bacteroides sp.]|nr:DUF1573 domain-containing protein [Bacteroides sp.]MCM1378553.1 DUF1573 domain-containing protein [Bacteroides sp.]MCM1444854.1 DUF1573 domain-containing protein [Prevotella sp.]
MNRKLTFIALSCIALCFSAQARWLKTAHDFGAFKEELGAVDAVFEVVNETPKPITIIEARATCGCTQPDYPTGEIAPGDTARLKVTYLASGRPGRFDKNIYVRTSDNRTERTTLTISGTVIGASATLASRFPVTAGPLRLKTSTVGFGEVLRGKQKTIFIEGYNQTADTLYPTISNLPDYIDVSITPEEVAPGEQVHFAFTLQTLRSPQWGISAEKFTLTPNAGEEPVEMDFFTIVSEDFSRLTPGQRLNAPVAKLEPQRIVFDKLESLEPFTAEFKVTNSGKSPLLLRRVQAEDPAVVGIKTSADKVKPGKTAKITLTIDPAKATTEFLNTRLTVITNDPENSLLTSRLTAEL